MSHKTEALYEAIFRRLKGNGKEGKGFPLFQSPLTVMLDFELAERNAAQKVGLNI
jgi:hypothetical protein